MLFCFSSPRPFPWAAAGQSLLAGAAWAPVWPLTIDMVGDLQERQRRCSLSGKELRQEAEREGQGFNAERELELLV